MIFALWVLTALGAVQVLNNALQAPILAVQATLTYQIVSTVRQDNIVLAVETTHLLDIVPKATIALEDKQLPHLHRWSAHKDIIARQEV